MGGGGAHTVSVGGGGRTIVVASGELSSCEVLDGGEGLDSWSFSGAIVLGIESFRTAVADAFGRRDCVPPIEGPVP